MGLLTLNAKYQTFWFAVAVIAFVGLGINLIFSDYILYGIILVVLGILGIFTIKGFSRIYHRPAESAEKHPLYIGGLIGGIIGAVIISVYFLLKGEEIQYLYTIEGLYYFLFVVLMVVIGALIQKGINKLRK